METCDGGFDEEGVKCIDTNLLVAILRGNEDAKKKMEELDRDGRQSTTSINSFELFYGAYNVHERVEEAITLLARMNVLPLDYESSKKAGEILAHLTRTGKPIDFRDALIAGVSLTNGLTLVTKNREHFSRIPGLMTESW
jgi:tRNA(fMet)-specific endonuclease VapC